VRQALLKRTSTTLIGERSGMVMVTARDGERYATIAKSRSGSRFKNERITVILPELQMVGSCKFLQDGRLSRI
jgi:hypothetical protein